MHLVVVHYHYRPGGVRRVVELGACAVVRHLPVRWQSVVLAGGEAPAVAWLEHLRAQLAPVPVQMCVERALAYMAETRVPVSRLRERLRRFWAGLFNDLSGAPAVVWAHNLGLGRNILLARELVRACHRRGIRLVSHHHDWWFEHRWHRWAELRRTGVGSFRALAETVLAAHPEVCHAVINRRDARALRTALGRQVAWLPNPMPPPAPVSATEVDAARRWLERQAPTQGRPVWIVPCRLLRRKNLAEAILLTRWLRPEACLLTTGGVSSREETGYARKLRDAVHRHRWPVWLGALEEAGAGAPGVYALMRAAEVVLLTSILEGFGLPYLEAAVVERPLIARAVAHVVPDLRLLGFEFPQLYREIWIPTASFDWAAEARRQRRLFEKWRRQLPAGLGRARGLRLPWEDPRAPRVVAFSSLTLTGQLEVLAQPPEQSWAACAAWNPRLVEWRRRLAGGGLQITAWPAKADRWLGPAGYARRWWRLVRSSRAGHSPGDPLRAQQALLEKTLASALRHPLLWAPRS
ncbi:hypothetical protein [Limisphaera sp. VF-2]|jgi:glycosyltransferase involved in cell wall biosynthesis|uniref:hypothetical protein n=1 Tax=Limisphaera sp. VF-2 TaxID=3400418 RepID=UPI00175ACFEB|nr:glycosyltransferase [Limisphaera sp.]